MFDKELQKLLKTEGLYSDNPVDSGGETYKGIARKRHKTWEGWPLIDALKHRPNFYQLLETDAELEKLVKKFYAVKFWVPLRCDSLPELLAGELFDTGVNQGVRTASKYFQRTLNLFNREQSLFTNLTVDGIIGSKTIKAFKKIKPQDVYLLYITLNLLQGMRYISLCEKDESQETFFRGWIKRVEITKH